MPRPRCGDGPVGPRGCRARSEFSHEHSSFRPFHGRLLVPVGGGIAALCVRRHRQVGFAGKPRNQGGFDNDHPRQWMARQTDWRARANAAQANSFEGLPFFMAAVIIAHQLGAAQTLLDILAFLYVLTRVVYITMYVGGLSSARSAAWAVGMLLNLVILFIGYH